MEKAFLSQVASLFVSDNLDDYTFIFPNRRSSLFFLKHLGDQKKKPLFAPKVFTIDSLFDYLSDLEVLDDLTLVFQLWQTYTALQTDFQLKAGVRKEDIKTESIDDFVSWGKIILSDFNDVDQYMVDASQLFMNLKDIKDLQLDTSYLNERTQLEALKRIGEFRDSLGEKDIIQRKFLTLWDMLLPLYDSFRNALRNKGAAYSGMQYRIVAESIVQAKAGDPIISRLEKLGQVVFIGFSAPSQCEKSLMTYFKNHGGLFYWDYYSDMIRTAHNRSSHLISKCVDVFSNSSRNIGPDGGWKKGRCKFNIIPASGSTEQAMIASKLLDIIKKDNVAEIETAVVVADETLLLPLLEMIGREDINVTMGYPLKATSIASLVFSLADLHLRSRHSKDGISLLPGEVLLSILNHPYIKEIDSQAASKATEHIQGSNLYMLDARELSGDTPLEVDSDSPLSGILKLLPPEDNMYAENGSSDIVSGIIGYYRRICEGISAHLSSVERSFLNSFLGILDRISASGIKFSQERSVYSVIRSAVRSASVPFRGEPLKGLQIMGALETRALDFDRVIFLSFNEGTYPASGEKSSCLPYFLRKGFGMPTYEDENSISAYNFYRLIQRASEVYMIYDTANTDKLRTKEESRFIKQLKYDFEEPLNEMKFDFPTPSSTKPLTAPVVLSDDDRLLLGNFFSDLRQDNLTKDTLRFFSASSLNNYIDCERKFFFSNVLRIKKEDDLSDAVEASTFGSIFHYCMEHIYDDYSGGKGNTLYVDGQVMSRIKKRALAGDYLDKLIQAAFDKEMRVKRIEGQNLVIKKSIEHYVRKALDADCSKAEVPYYLLGNEVPAPVDLGEAFSNACFTGKLDRLEEAGGIPRICDYKTGKFLIIEDRKGLLATLDALHFKSNPQPHYLPVKELEDSDFEVLLESMFRTEVHRDKYSSIMFQLFVYAFLHRQKYGKSSDIYLSIYQLPVIEKCGPMTIRITDSQLDVFSVRLSALLKGIRIKAETPGSVMDVCQKVKDNCDICDFNKYCRRSNKNE
ncbi:MAG: PD-(D/E)XK nuclease family protein [Bacteroidales bacterium]|nr:PD-(D/E)XK nuclease family protein [Bacteroidales bacterium]